MAKVQYEFRAEVLSGAPRLPSVRPVAAPAETRPLVPCDTQMLTRGVKGSLRWPQAAAAEAEPPQATQSSLRDEVANLLEALVGAVRSPAGRQARKQVLLGQAQQAAMRLDSGSERRLLGRVLALDPADAVANARMGRLHLDAGAFDRAAPHVEAAAAARPRDPAAQIALGELQYRRSDPDSAIVAFGRALRLNPDHSDANAWLGILAHDAQRPVEAQRFLERAIALDSNHSVARYYLAQLSLANGDKLRADYQLSVVRKLEPQANLGRTDALALPAGSRTTTYLGWRMPSAAPLVARA